MSTIPQRRMSRLRNAYAGIINLIALRFKTTTLFHRILSLIKIITSYLRNMSKSHHLLSTGADTETDHKDSQESTAMQSSSNAALKLCRPHETTSVHQLESLKTSVKDSFFQIDNACRGFLVVPDKLKRHHSAPLSPFRGDKVKCESSPCPTLTCTTTPPIITRKVRFDESRNESYGNTEAFKEELKDQWYTTQDTEDFKDATNAFLRDVILEDKRNKARYSFRKVVLSAYDACCESVYETDASLLSKDEEYYLKQWLSLASNLVGVERWAVRQIRVDVKNRKRLLLERILAIQKMGRLVALNDDAEDDVLRTEFLDTQADFLKKSCEAISRPSRLFARHMGRAQAASIDNVV
jgi:hypothetical protein